jgi:uncharacterized protein (TIGR03437 family)
MKSSTILGTRLLPGLILALACSVPGMAQNLLTATPSSVSLTCNTNTTGPSAAVSVVVRPVTNLTGSNILAVTFGSVGAGLVVTAPATPVLTAANSVAGLTYTVRIANGCSGASSGTAAPTFRFSRATTVGGSATADVTVTANTTVTVGSTSPLTVNPAAVSLTCMKSGSTYTPGVAQKTQIRSLTTGGTPFTVNNSGAGAPPAWLTVSPLSGGTASATAVELSMEAAAGCGAFAVGSVNTATVQLLNAPAPVKPIQVTLRIVAPSPLTATPNPANLVHTKGGGTPGRVDVSLTSTVVPAPFFTVNTATLPTWLNVDAVTGTVPRSLRFTVTAIADTMAPGTYSATVRVQVANYADLSIPITLQLNNRAPRLSVAEGTQRLLSWTVGTPLPAPYVTAVSSDSPIPYTVETDGPLKPIVATANLKDLAYSFGTPIPITFDPNIFAAAVPGTTLEGTVSLTWGSPSSTITVTFKVDIQAPGATLTSITPASLPTANPGVTYTLVLTGSSFVTGTDPTIRTRVGIVSGSTFAVDPNISVNVVNSSSIILTIVVPSGTSTTLPFSPSGTGGTVIVGVCNPAGSTCTTPTSTASFNIGSNPIIQSVTSSASFIQVTAPTIQTIAPYDLLSLFGANFCSSGGRGCASTDTIKGIPDAATLAYPTWVSPDEEGSTQRKLTAVFQTRGGTPTVIATAPILFATNNQINLIVPAALASNSGTDVDLVVRFGYGSGSTMLSSTPFQLTVADTNPGLFTVAANGQGDGAILNSNLALVVPGNEAGVRSTGSDSDVVQLFVTGLGVPNSTADNTTAGTSSAWSGDCITMSSYLDSLNVSMGSAVTTMDGLILNSALLNTARLVPCFASGSARVPAVTIGGVAGTVTYAGWVPDNVAGLYQVNVRLPSSTGAYTTAAGTSLSAVTVPVQLPVVVTSASKSSQARVNLWVARKLKVAAPSGAGLTGTVGVAWATSNNSVVATQGTPSYRYAVTSGLLPAGLTLNASTGAISGIPAADTAGSYLVTVTATDSANFPISDKVSFTITITGGLVLTSTGTAPYNEIYGTADASVTTVTATGGVYPYTYALSGPSPLPFGLTVDTNTGVIGVSAFTPAGTYHVAVTATDSTSGTPLTGTINFDLVVALRVVRSTPATGANGTASDISTVTATGQTGTVSYALDSTSAALSWLSINSSTGVISITNAAPASTSRTVTVTATDGTAAPGAATAGSGTVTVVVAIN